MALSTIVLLAVASAVAGVVAVAGAGASSTVFRGTSAQGQPVEAILSADRRAVASFRFGIRWSCTDASRPKQSAAFGRADRLRAGGRPMIRKTVVLGGKGRGVSVFYPRYFFGYPNRQQGSLAA